jgi:FtsH-binding integral membrane protein
MLLIVGALLFGWNLGVWFSVAMVALSGAAILYQTQNIIRNFPANAHVGAAVQLFGSVMTMFWYILRIFSSRN